MLLSPTRKFKTEGVLNGAFSALSCNTGKVASKRLYGGCGVPYRVRPRVQLSGGGRGALAAAGAEFYNTALIVMRPRGGRVLYGAHLHVWHSCGLLAGAFYTTSIFICGLAACAEFYTALIFMCGLVVGAFFTARIYICAASRRAPSSIPRSSSALCDLVAGSFFMARIFMCGLSAVSWREHSSPPRGVRGVLYRAHLHVRPRGGRVLYRAHLHVRLRGGRGVLYRAHLQPCETSWRARSLWRASSCAASRRLLAGAFFTAHIINLCSFAADAEFYTSLIIMCGLVAGVFFTAHVFMFGLAAADAKFYTALIFMCGLAFFTARIFICAASRRARSSIPRSSSALCDLVAGSFFMARIFMCGLSTASLAGRILYRAHY
jgi:hypothetical protein